MAMKELLYHETLGTAQSTDHHNSGPAVARIIPVAFPISRKKFGHVLAGPARVGMSIDNCLYYTFAGFQLNHYHSHNTAGTTAAN
uniref:Unplaced genomic scaffold supercont1.21, whole genome shotgun sequence n=1 Tax=Cryptococcus bacillisporus CA1280 TaxID=1296109 RepID=A0A0D0U9F1_CRYGA|nr:hypothetical protein I312_05876 [Cryptococcus bacillisporus CA1280]